MLRFGALCAAIVMSVCLAAPANARVDRTAHYLKRMEAFRADPITPDDIVLIGDSLIAQGHWQDWLGRTQVRNFGIGGDTTVAMFRRLRMITRAEPRAIIVQIGTNDLRGGAKPSLILKNYERILARIRAESPSTLLVVMSLPPKQSRFADQVWQINKAQKVLAERYGGLFVDLFEPLRDRYGGFERRYTTDFVHFSARGYRVVAEELEAVLPVLDGSDHAMR